MKTEALRAMTDEELQQKLGETTWGNHVSPTSPLLQRCARVKRSWPPGRQSRPPAATQRAPVEVERHED